MKIDLLTTEAVLKLPIYMRKCPDLINENKCCAWWLRSETGSQKVAFQVNSEGQLDYVGMYQTDKLIGIRPCLYLTEEEFFDLQWSGGRAELFGIKWLDISYFTMRPCLLAEQCLSMTNCYRLNIFIKLLNHWLETKKSTELNKTIDKNISYRKMLKKYQSLLNEIEHIIDKMNDIIKLYCCECDSPSILEKTLRTERTTLQELATYVNKNIDIITPETQHLLDDIILSYKNKLFLSLPLHSLDDIEKSR